VRKEAQILPLTGFIALDDQEKLKDLERQKLLEEIRKRAEEAELKRIEEEEQRANFTARPIQPVEPPKPAPVGPLQASEPLESSHPQDDAKLNDLREKFSIAVDRGKLEKASELFDELSPLIVDGDEGGELRERLQKLRRQHQDEAKAKKRAAEQQGKESAAQERARRESLQKKIAGLFQKANNFYQSEKYDKGQETLDEILALDQENDEARQLAADIAKAKELAERIREEEARRRAQEAAVAPPPTPQAAPVPQTPGEVWGSKEITRAEDELGLPPIAEGPAAPPKPPVVETIVDRLSKIHIPLKPVLVSVGAIAMAASVYFVISSLIQAVSPPKYSLLILPAMGTTVDSSAQFLSEAVTEDLINTVSAVADLRVVAQATSLSLRTYAGDFSQVARRLGASYYLQWTVSRLDDQVTYQITLFDTTLKNPVWSKQMQSSVRELQSVTREVGRAIIREMKVATTPQEEEAFTKVSNTSSEAYEAYARGRWYQHQDDLMSTGNAISSFASAVERDSLFSEAHVALAWAHLEAIDRGIDAEMSQVQLAWRHLNKALALGARSSESYRVRGLIAQYQLQYDRAVDELERGAAFAPSDAETQRRLAVVYAIKGRIDDASRVAAKAVADDPRNVDSYTTMGLIQLFHAENLRSLGESNEKEYADALKSFEQGVLYAQDRSGYASSEYADLLEYAHQPDRAAQILVDRAAQTQHYVDYYKLGRIYQTSGKPKPQWEAVFQRAKTILDAAVTANPLDARTYSHLALIETRLGSYKNALEASSRARQLAPNDVDVLYNTARMFALQTDKVQALEYLGKAVDIRYRLSSILDMDFYNLRSEPEFQSAVTR
jgi:TolB-like protein/Tfp pilus assembly protein PilF